MQEGTSYYQPGDTQRKTGDAYPMDDPVICKCARIIILWAFSTPGLPSLCTSIKRVTQPNAPAMTMLLQALGAWDHHSFPEHCTFQRHMCTQCFTCQLLPFSISVQTQCNVSNFFHHDNAPG